MTLITRILVVLAASLASFAHAQTYPSKTVRVVVGFPAGGSQDIVARLVSQKLTEAFGQQFIVDNRSGAAGNIGADVVAKAPPDGYTLLQSSATALASNLSIYKKLPFDPRRDLAPIVLVAHQPHVLVLHPSLPTKTVKEFIALAKANPGKLNYATTGIGATQHLIGEMFIMMTGVNIVGVPYKGGAPAFTALLSGEIEAMFQTVPTVIGEIKSGKVRALAVTSPQRVAMIPNVPTMDEAGLKGFDYRSWMGWSATGGTPREIIARLNAAINDALKKPDLRKRLADLGLDVAGATTEEFEAFIRKEIDLYAKIVKASGMPLQ